MGQAYDKSTLTLTALTAHRLSDLLAAEGYTGSMIGSFLELEDSGGLGDVYHGDSASVDAATGRSLTVYVRTSPPVVDPSRIWLFSTAGGNISCTFEPGGF